jgi:hypothetical protein
MFLWWKECAVGVKRAPRLFALSCPENTVPASARAAASFPIHRFNHGPGTHLARHTTIFRPPAYHPINCGRNRSRVEDRLPSNCRIFRAVETVGRESAGYGPAVFLNSNLRSEAGRVPEPLAVSLAWVTVKDRALSWLTTKS